MGLIQPPWKLIHHVATGSEEGTVRVWDAATGEELRRYPGQYVAVAPDGRTLATWGTRVNRGDDKVQLWDAPTGKLLKGVMKTMAQQPDDANPAPAMP